MTWQTDPFYVDFFNHIPKPIQDYVDRLAYLGRPEASHDDVIALTAHAYVRYLGDLSGGQIIRRRIIKAYDLYEDGEGLAFYNFRTLDYRTGDKPAEMHEIRRIKNWFKDGLNETVIDPKTKGEAKMVFHSFYLNLFILHFHMFRRWVVLLQLKPLTLLDLGRLPPPELLIAEANAGFLYNAGVFSAIDVTQTLEKEKALLESQSHPITQVLDKFTASMSVGTVAAVVLAACGVRALWTLNGLVGENEKGNV